MFDQPLSRNQDSVKRIIMLRVMHLPSCKSWHSEAVRPRSATSGVASLAEEYESHVVSQLGMIRQAYNPRSNIFYAEEFCLFEHIVSYLSFLDFQNIPNHYKKDNNFLCFLGWTQPSKHERSHLITLITKAIDTTSLAINLYGYAAGGETSPAFCSQKTRPF